MQNEGASRDLLLLDIALDSYFRLCVERTDKGALQGEARQWLRTHKGRCSVRRGSGGSGGNTVGAPGMLRARLYGLGHEWLQGARSSQARLELGRAPRPHGAGRTLASTECVHLT